MKKNEQHSKAKKGRPLNQEARAERMKQILDGARKCFVERGFHGASISDITESADVSAANIYQYFSNKDALIVALAEDDLKQDIQLIQSIAGTDLQVDEMAQYLGAVFSTAEGLQKARMRIEILSEASRNPQIAKLVRDWGAVSAKTVEAVILELQKKKRVPKSIMPHEAADKICVLYEGLTNRYVINHKSGHEFLSQFVLGVRNVLGLKVSQI